MLQPQTETANAKLRHHAITLRLTSSKRLSRSNLTFTFSTQSTISHHCLGTTTTHAHPSATASDVTVGFKLPAALHSHHHITHAATPHFEHFHNSHATDFAFHSPNHINN
jgi:hypothetical protein